jgi:hypothetical protein
MDRSLYANTYVGMRASTFSTIIDHSPYVNAYQQRAKPAAIGIKSLLGGKI